MRLFYRIGPAFLWAVLLQPLLYPYSDSVSGSEFQYTSDDNVNVNVVFIDLRNADKCITDLIAKVC